jgi:MerR family transcriptional regulator, copper efflux regulator
MTVGELSRRTGLPPKAIRDFEARGLIYSAGRSEANYRLFDGSALWCVRVIANLRSLGLTLKEIEELAVVYLDRPGEPLGPHLGAALERAERRIEERVAELEVIRRRIEDYRRRNAAALTGTGGCEFPVGDPRRPRAGA